MIRKRGQNSIYNNVLNRDSSLGGASEGLSQDNSSINLINGLGDGLISQTAQTNVQYFESPDPKSIGRLNASEYSSEVYALSAAKANERKKV